MQRAWVLLSLFALGCGPSNVDLFVDLRTDLVPGAEFFAVEVSLPDDDRVAPATPALLGMSFEGAGMRVGEFSGVRQGARRVVVAVLDARGAPVASEEVLVDLSSDRVVTVVITRDCRTFSCPGPAGAPGATRCLGTRCVEPTCLTGAEEGCGESECASDAECTSSSPCASAVCTDGVCLSTSETGACAENEFCDPDDDCRPAPTIPGGECESEPYVVTPGCGTGPECDLVVATMDAGWSHACAVDAGGQLYCWGTNAGGQLGVGDLFGRLRATAVPLPAQVLQVGTGSNFTCALLEDADIWCWGNNDVGQLGSGDAAGVDEPAAPIPRPGAAWQSVSTGSSTACAIDTDGALYCWGDNEEGQTGHGIREFSVAAPTRVGAATWSSVHVSQGHACGLQTDGSLWCWGRNTSSELGLGPGSAMQHRAPQRVGAAVWTALDTSPIGGCAQPGDGTLHCWGHEGQGAMGFGETDRLVDAPLQRTDAVDWIHEDGDAFHGCGIRTGGAAWCWGRATEGQLGFTQADAQLVSVDVAPGETFSDLVVDRFASYLLRSDGALLSSGTNCGRVGDGETERPYAFVRVSR